MSQTLVVGNYLQSTETPVENQYLAFRLTRTRIYGMALGTTSCAFVRHATLDDYEDIMKINVSDTYSDFDYLPKMFFEYMNSPRCRNYVCVLNGEIIGYEGALMQDEGQTIQFKAARVKVTFRGQGYCRLMEDFIMSDFQNLPSIKHVVSVKVGHTVSTQWQIVERNKRFDFNKCCPRKMETSLFPEVYRLSKDEILQLFSFPFVCERIFPEDLFTIGLTVKLRVLPDNVKLISDTDSVFVSFNKNVHRQQASFRQMYLYEDTALLSIGSEIDLRPKCDNIYNVYFYGDGLDHLAAHIDQHINRAIKKQGPIINFRLTLKETIPENVVLSVMRAYVWKLVDKTKSVSFTTCRKLLSVEES